MAFPTIPTTGAQTLLTTNQSTATTTHQFPSLTTLAQAAGDLMIAVIVTYNGGAANAQFSAWGGGFTEFVDQSANSTTVQSIGAAYKFADGTETGTFTVTTASSTRSVMFLMTIPGAHGSTLPEATAKANGTGAAADPAALNPANWDAEDTLWIAVGVNGETSLTGSFTGITAAPTNYTGYLDSGIIGGDVIGALEGAVAFRQLNAASEDVGTFTLDVGAAGNSALVIAVRPVVTELADAEAAAATGAAFDATVTTVAQFTVATRTSQNTSDSTSQVVTLPNGSNVSGRLVVVVIGVDGTTGVAWPAGWTEIFDGTTVATELAVGYRVINGTEGFDGTDDTITLTTAAEQSNSHAYLITGHDPAVAPEAATAAVGTNAPDPPSFNPAGWDVEETLWIVAAANRFGILQTAAPANYSNLLAQNGGDTNAPLATAHRGAAVTTEDPGAFTGGDNEWVATTIAVPALAVGTNAAAEAATATGAASDATAEVLWSVPQLLMAPMVAT
jgi:hypothetical protein